MNENEFVCENQIFRQFLKMLSNSFVYTRITKKMRPTNSQVFYSLSNNENYDFNKSPMKDNLGVIRSKRNYLAERYSKRPSEKYNFPEATSWRYGWNFK